VQKRRSKLKVRVIALIGPPGSGKGTTKKYVIQPYCEKHGIPLIIIPMSEEISLYLDENAGIAPSVRQDMAEGRLVADKIVIEVLRRALKRIKKLPNAIYVLDGMPRTMGQFTTCFYEVLEAFDIKPHEYLFANLKTPAWLWGFRAANRKEDRADDGNEEVFITRCGEFEHKTVPTINHIQQNAERVGYGYLELNGQFIRSQPQLATDQIFGHQ
jgi:adenylate kinase family enzyme